MSVVKEVKMDYEVSWSLYLWRGGGSLKGVNVGGIDRH